MKPQIFRLAIIWSLTAIFLFSTFPAGLAGNGRVQQQTSNPSTTRRGKNGSTANASTPSQQNPQSSAIDKANAKTPEQKQEPASTQNSTSTQGEKAAEEKPAGEKEVPTTFEEAQPKQQGKRQPLPFDRPPLGAQESDNSVKKAPDFDRPASTTAPGASSTKSSGPQANTQPQRPNVSVQQPPQSPDYSSSRPSTQSTQSQRYPSGGTDSQRYPETNNPKSQSDNDPYSSSRTSPPVLKRESDSRNQGSKNADPRGAPPVLRRPTDNTQSPSESDRPANSQSSSSPNSRNYPQNGSAQSPQTDAQDDTIKLDATLVNIPILVSDRSNRFVPRLTAKDFLLYEDGVQQEVAFFGNEEVPFSVALVLDMSPSVSGNTQDIQDAAIDFIRQLRPDDKVMIVSFDRHVDYLTDFTSDRRVLERAIESTRTGSGTSVYDAVYETVARKLRNVEGRKALILFSDGEDTTSSKAGYDDAVNIVTESDVLVYGLRYPNDGGGGNVRVNPWPRSPIPNIGFPLPFPWPFPRRRGGHYSGNSSGQPNTQWPRRGGRGGRGGDFMADITSAGGGPVFDAQNVGDMRGLANKIAEELRHVYQISYYPTNSLTNGGYRAIRIRVKNRDDIAVRHRKGYNAREVAKGSKI
jgi:Ca-activated chloride channel family protein